MKSSLAHKPDNKAGAAMKQKRAGTLFGGTLVDANVLRRDYLDNMPIASLTRLLKEGLPHVVLPKSQKHWFNPPECLKWYLKHQVQLNQRRLGRPSNSSRNG